MGQGGCWCSSRLGSRSWLGLTKEDHDFGREFLKQTQNRNQNFVMLAIQGTLGGRCLRKRFTVSRVHLRQIILLRLAAKTQGRTLEWRQVRDLIVRKQFICKIVTTPDACNSEWCAKQTNRDGGHRDLRKRNESKVALTVRSRRLEHSSYLELVAKTMWP